jgi:5-methylcytosine-specific restriction endonuclease McrA
MKQDYKKYLKSASWRLKKQELFNIVGRNCEKCGSKKNIEVHHLHYKNIFKEKIEDLKVLCDKCHKKEHGIDLGKKNKKRKKKNYNKSTNTSDKFNKPKIEEPKKISNRQDIKRRIEESKQIT